jgi:hypothetical protein
MDVKIKEFGYLPLHNVIMGLLVDPPTSAPPCNPQSTLCGALSKEEKRM